MHHRNNLLDKTATISKPVGRCALLSAVILVSMSTAGLAQPGKVEHLPTVVLQTPFSEYKNSDVGISFQYPKEWKESKPLEKEAIVKFAGQVGEGLSGDVVLSRFSDGNTPESVKSVLNQFVFNKLEDLKKIQEKKVAIGAGRRLPAELQDISFAVVGLKIQQRYVLFSHKSDTYTLVFTAPAAQFNSLTPVFNNVLLSIQTSGGTASNTKTAAVAKPVTPAATPPEKAIVLKTYKSSIVPISFGYPDDWKVAEGGRHDEPVNIQGANAKGSAAVIVLHRGEMHPSLSVDDVADALQKEYFEPQKSFHQVTRQSQSFGSMSKIHGVVQEQTFEKDGTTVKQMVAMFHHGDKTYALSLLAPGWKDSDMHNLFYKVLASVNVQD